MVLTLRLATVMENVGSQVALKRHSLGRYPASHSVTTKPECSVCMPSQRGVGLGSAEPPQALATHYSAVCHVIVPWNRIH